MNNEQAETITVYATKDLTEVTAYRLAQFADSGEPESPDSAGAKLLISVRDSVAELLDNLDADDVERIVNDPADIGWLDDSGAIAEIADGAPNVYTYPLWNEFVDLSGWAEDRSEVGDSGTDMTEMARVALYMIAERLAWALLNTAALTMADFAERMQDDL